MTIKPLNKIIQIKAEEATAGVLDTSSKASAIEYGEVEAIGPDVFGLNVGDKLFFKSWAVDIIDHQDKKYHFINQDSGGIIAVVHD